MCVIFPYENNSMLFNQAVSCDAVPVSNWLNICIFKYYSHLSFIQNNKWVMVYALALSPDFNLLLKKIV